MGQIYAISGCSGVGKTTFLNKLFSNNQEKLRLLSRTTSRDLRPHEKEGVDYYFLPKKGFLQKIFANDFVHIEEYENSYFGIEARFIEETIKSNEDGIIMAGVFGASKLKAVYGGNVSVLFMHSGTRSSVLDPRTLEDNFESNIELKRRLEMKFKNRLFNISEVNQADIDTFVSRRMELNYLELAFINGRIRSGEQITILENQKDELDKVVNQFKSLRGSNISFSPLPFNKSNLCFVLMPFKPELKPIYDDHISKSLQELGIDALRADAIFSNKPIIDDILNSLRNARIVIADLTTNNPNVFYETGICMALGKEIILITQDEEVPFDLKHIRHIKYKYTPRGMTEFETILKKTIHTILNS